MKLPAQQEMLVTWGGLILVGGIVAYLVVKYGLPKLARGAATGAADTLNGINQGLGNNALTSSQTDFGGDRVDYSGHGVISTVGAEANAVSGGTLASGGESIGSGLFSLFGPKDTTPTNYYTVQFPDGSKHAVGDTAVDASGYFSYGGQRFRLGQVNGQRVATMVYTGTGV